MRAGARRRMALAAVGIAAAAAVGASGAPRLPELDAGSQPAPGAGLGAPQDCFGAATRDPQRRCENPRLKFTVVPSPRQASTLPNAPCTPVEWTARIRVCEFGAPADQALATIALVGDSHASHWRAAMQTVAQARRWRGLSIMHTSCPLSEAVRDLPEPKRSRCSAWRQAVLEWFAGHPEATTVFVGGLTGGSGVIPTPGRGRFESAIDGYLAAWRALPPTVRHIVVLRDTPKARPDTNACIERALLVHEPPGPTCAVARRGALDPDAQLAAAARLRSARVQTVDLTPFFCDRRLCYPVVGGALVLRDENHLTATFSSTLGPYLLRDVDRLTASWR